MIVFYGGIHLHTFVLEMETKHDTPFIIERVEGVYTQGKVRTERVAVHLADGSWHTDRGCTSKVV